MDEKRKLEHRYTIECVDEKATFDLHLDDADDLEDAKEKARYWTSKGYSVELALTAQFLSGNYNPIEFKKVNYAVDFLDYENGAESTIDNIVADADYTAGDYVKDCERDADDEWIEMLRHGKVTLVEVEG